MTKDIVEERGYTVDLSGFETAEQEHALVSGGGKAMGTISSADAYNALLDKLKATGALSDTGVLYTPYDDRPLDARLIALLRDGEAVGDAASGDRVAVVLDHTNFYVESGGQVSDTGVIEGDGWRIEIDDTRRPVSGLIIHSGEVIYGTPTINAPARTIIDHARRSDIIRNHTATHLLHAALRHHLGTHVQQKGSLVAPDRLRFDFAHDERVSIEQLRAIETEVNAIIMTNYRVTAAEKALSEARAEGGDGALRRKVR